LLTPKSKPLPHMCYHAKFVLRQRVYATSLNCSLLPALRIGLPTLDTALFTRLLTLTNETEMIYIGLTTWRLLCIMNIENAAHSQNYGQLEF